MAQVAFEFVNELLNLIMILHLTKGGEDFTQARPTFGACGLCGDG